MAWARLPGRSWMMVGRSPSSNSHCTASRTSARAVKPPSTNPSECLTPIRAHFLQYSTSSADCMGAAMARRCAGGQTSAPRSSRHYTACRATRQPSHALFLRRRRAPALPDGAPSVCDTLGALDSRIRADDQSRAPAGAPCRLAQPPGQGTDRITKMIVDICRAASYDRLRSTNSLVIKGARS